MRFAFPIPESFRRLVSAGIHAIRLNAISAQLRDRRPVILKTRSKNGAWIARLTNFYFRLAGIPIRYWTEISAWQRWEIESFNLLNGEEFRATALGDRTVCADKIPGRSVWDHMLGGTLTPRILEAAARELRRAHQFWSDEFRAAWSHGDLSITNILYDERAERARLIDFEIAHTPLLPEVVRQADDVIVILLDLSGVVADHQWLPFALAFFARLRPRRSHRESE